MIYLTSWAGRWPTQTSPLFTVLVDQFVAQKHGCLWILFDFYMIWSVNDSFVIFHFFHRLYSQSIEYPDVFRFQKWKFLYFSLGILRNHTNLIAALRVWFYVTVPRQFIRHTQKLYVIRSLSYYISTILMRYSSNIEMSSCLTCKDRKTTIRSCLFRNRDSYRCPSK